MLEWDNRHAAGLRAVSTRGGWVFFTGGVAMARVAVLDDYQDMALKMADWRMLPSDTSVQVFNDHLSQEQAVAERLTRLYRVHPSARSVGSDWPTMSAGLASVLDDRPASAQQLCDMADQALYASKKAGRGRCIAWSELGRARSSHAA